RTALRPLWRSAKQLSTTGMVKVFGRRPSLAVRLGKGPAYENRPCTNPRGCGDGLWGFRVLLGYGDGETGWALEPAGAW
ncbi:MAG TPA: hypothetical protein VMU82_13090, partial [Acetobacteraceae bacterium]|nr:hypothetical protein [Acetobacteraceae bacterium]